MVAYNLCNWNPWQNEIILLSPQKVPSCPLPVNHLTDSPTSTHSYDSFFHKRWILLDFKLHKSRIIYSICLYRISLNTVFRDSFFWLHISIVCYFLFPFHCTHIPQVLFSHLYGWATANLQFWNMIWIILVFLFFIFDSFLVWMFCLYKSLRVKFLPHSVVVYLVLNMHIF